jgi:Flp pilus assembly protein TadD
MALPHLFTPRFAFAVAVCTMLAAPPVLASEIKAITKQIHKGDPLAAPSAQGNEIKAINQQIQKGDLAGALTRANAYLAKNPKDEQIRFLKGLILTDQGKTDEAITVFAELTDDYPELPEPYNNLAVLYASQNKFEAAQHALESAIRANPGYATAHENLGDIYAKMALIAYDKALALDGKNAAVQTKLTLIQSMLGGQARKPAMAQPDTASPKSVPDSSPPAPAR